jgi:nucleoid-associated protein YgaU
MNTMNDKVKMGIAIATLVGIVVLIVLDRKNLQAPASADASGGGRSAIVVAGDSGAAVRVTAPVPPTPLEAARVPEVKPSAAAPPVRPEAAEAAAPVKPAEPAPAKATPSPFKPAALETLPGGRKMYTVVPGDTLYGISIKVFNTPRYYERIYELNRERIEDPNTLQIGLKLVMPDIASKPASDPVGTAPPVPGVPAAAPQDRPSDRLGVPAK